MENKGKNDDNTYDITKISEPYKLNSSKKELQRLSSTVPKDCLWVSFRYNGLGEATRCRLNLHGPVYEFGLDVLMVDGYLVSILGQGINELLHVSKVYNIPTLIPDRLSTLEEVYKSGHIVVPLIGTEDLNLGFISYYKIKQRKK